MRSDAHPFICSACKLVTPHIELTKYETSDVKDAPEEVWLVECQRCFLQRIIYPSDREEQGIGFGCDGLRRLALSLTASRNNC